MGVFGHGRNTRQAVLSLVSVTAIAVAAPQLARAQQNASDGEKHTHQRAEKSPPAGQSLADQLRQLQTKVAKLEAALKQKHKAKTPEAAGGMGMRMGSMPMGSGANSGSMQGMGMMGQKMMGGKGGMMGMGMMSKKGSMAGKQMSDKSNMGDMKTTGGMKMMGRMKGMSGMKAAEPLPAFPDAPGVYHIGATGFYLDHADAIALTPEQQTKLTQIKDEAMSQQAGLEQQIAEADEQLGTLTGSDQPDVAKIDAQVREIERLGGDRRMAFIRAVGRAATVLTDEQRKALTGMAKQH